MSGSNADFVRIRCRRFAVCGIVVLCATPCIARAQSSSANATPRWAIGVAGDIGALSDALSTQCGEGGGGAPMVGGGVSVLFASRPWMVIAGDLRASAIPPIGCSLVVAAPMQVGPNQWESPPSQDYRSVPKAPLTRSAVRVGIQTPDGAPLMRVTVGGGLLWAARPAPFATAAVGIGSRGRSIRFYGEFELDVARVRVNESRTFYHMGSGGALVLDSRSTTAVVAHPAWGALHVGVEVPLRR